VVRALLAKGADVEAKDYVSLTPTRTDAPAREASHKHARETIAAETAGTVTSLTQYRALAASVPYQIGDGKGSGPVSCTRQAHTTRR
jgi:hypothetical protein